MSIHTIKAVMEDGTISSKFLKYIYYETNVFSLFKKGVDYIGNPCMDSGITFRISNNFNIDDFRSFLETIDEKYGDMQGCRKMMMRIMFINPISLFWEPRNMAA